MRAWKQRKFTDAAVVCSEERIPVHRATLCAASPVFDAAFTSSMEEGASATYTVRDADPAAVEALLRFLYTGAACAPDAELEPAPLLDLAVFYQVTANAETELEPPESYRLLSAVSMPISDMQRPCVCEIRKERKKAIFFLPGVCREVEKLALAAAKDMLIGVTADNVRERARTLKRHADHPALPDVWPRFREILKTNKIRLSRS